MQNLIRFLDRRGQYKEMHVISIRYVTDIDSEELVIEFSGIDDTMIMSLGAANVSRLEFELTKGRQAIDTIRDRKERQRKKAEVMSDKTRS